jgi:hypothetical protein
VIATTSQASSGLRGSSSASTRLWDNQVDDEVDFVFKRCVMLLALCLRENASHDRGESSILVGANSF